MRQTILNLMARAARMLPNSVKLRIYRLPALARLVRLGLNKAVPDKMTLIEIAAGDLRGQKMFLDLQTEKDYWLGTYEQELQSAIRAWVKPGLVAYDVGANIGYISLLLGKAVGNQGRVLSFEALPQNVNRLRANIGANDMEERIRIEHCAVVDKLGPVNFMLGPSGGTGKASGSAGRDNLTYGKSVSVPGVSLDAFVYDQSNPIPNVVKIDIEGGEVLALPGMRILLSEAQPLIFLELHGPIAAQVAWEMLKLARYRLYSLENGYPEIKDYHQLDWKAYLMAVPTS